MSESAYTQFYFESWNESTQELLLLHLDETGKKEKLKATEYTEPGRKKGNGRSEDADIELKQRFNNTEPWRRSTVTRKFLNKFASFRTIKQEIKLRLSLKNQAQSRPEALCRSERELTKQAGEVAV